MRPTLVRGYFHLGYGQHSPQAEFLSIGATPTSKSVNEAMKGEAALCASPRMGMGGDSFDRHSASSRSALSSDGARRMGLAFMLLAWAALAASSAMCSFLIP